MRAPVLLVEDDIKIARIIKAYLEGADFRVCHALSASEARQFFAHETPLAVILDLGLPDSPGEELCQEFKDSIDIPVLMVTAKSSEDERIAGFALGADDYLVKPASPRELVYRLKAILKRYGLTSGGGQLSFNQGAIVIDTLKHTVIHQGRPCDITPSEFKLLVMLASAPGRAFTRDELVSRALGYQCEGYDRTIDTHIKNLRQKLEDDNRNPTLIKTVYGVGYLFTGAPDAVHPAA
ncbi:MAG: response regulator transcription factor [Trichlorobacter sp.]|jgi:two-component system OmpR family response regulator